MTAKTTSAAGAAEGAEHIGAVHDLTVAAEFLMAALREITAGASPRDRKVRQWVGTAARKLEPLAARDGTREPPGAVSGG